MTDRNPFQALPLPSGKFIVATITDTHSGVRINPFTAPVPRIRSHSGAVLIQGTWQAAELFATAREAEQAAAHLNL